jgi:formiminotetrahydrofolate cyclodeaminase
MLGNITKNIKKIVDNSITKSEYNEILKIFEKIKKDFEKIKKDFEENKP